MIYGGGGGIGGAVSRVLAREGARVFIGGRTQARLDAVAPDIAAAGGAAETALLGRRYLGKQDPINRQERQDRQAQRRLQRDKRAAGWSTGGR